ncbi:hypothetical protein CU098_005823 [Rhizopus stolonifer]|uniref:Pre-rRNA processing protein n=1 Tax=Rhizopus stolonifer TaxID=4846 RepID=A0A367KM09_RHIST|nr:hypothetical protein CU098_005823 [Rhizopus stolonifer]
MNDISKGGYNPQVIANHSQYSNETMPRESYHDENEHIMEEYAEKPILPLKRPFYKKKKYWIICSVLSAIILIVVIVLILYVFFPMIAQSLMNQAKIDVGGAQISFTKPDVLNGQTYTKRDGDDLNSTFYMNMESTLKNTGPFAASIKFHNPIQVLYNDTTLGEIYLYNDTHISSGHGTLNAITPFVIKDLDAFTLFTKDMLAVKEFSWTLVGKLDITALSSSFKLPSDAAEGGIQVELGTVLTSPSPIGVQLGTIQLQIGYEGVYLGIVSAQDVNLHKGDNDILLKGRLVPQNDTASLDKVSQLFSNYVSGQISQTSATGISCAPDGINPVIWLSEGFKTVQLNVALAADEPLKIIQSVSMGQIDLKFDSSNPYAPVATAPKVVANFQIPFGFSLNITQVTQNITLGLDENGKSTNLEDFATILVPYTDALSDQKAGKLQFGIANTPIAGISDADTTYDEYIYSLTASDNYTFGVSGNATTKVSTPIGAITLGGISFSVPTSLRGLQFLNSSATVINSLDVTGGTNDGMLLGINVTMVNPSDVTISTGDVHFRMTASDVDLGLVTLKALTLNRGSNVVAAQATFDPKSSDVGQNILSTFVMGGNSNVQIVGFDESTAVASLTEALSAIDITSTLPGLTTALIQGSALTVYPDTNSTGAVGVKVSIANPFSAGLSIDKVVAAATYRGTPVGNIDQDLSTNPFIIPGKSTAQSQELSMNMNIEPAAIALLLRELAVNSNMDTKALDGLLGLGGFHVAGQQDVAAEVSTFSGFNISEYTLQAMKALKVDLSLSSGLNIGQYQDTLAFSQNSVAVSTDNSVLTLIPIVGQKIVQQIVDGAVLAFETIIVSSPTDSSFTVQMKGSITKSGPMDAAISFPTPLTVYWQGSALGTVSMPEIQAKAGLGASFDVTGTFTLSDKDYMAKFATYLINNEDFKWEIITKDVSVNALGFTFTGISMDKFVTLSGCNGFKDAVTIQSFDLPSNDPDGGITLTAQTTIKNPSQVGFNLSGVTFESYFKNVDIGPLSSNGNAVFPPQGSSVMAMKGRMIPQSSSEGLAAVTTVFENYLNASNSVLTVKGISGSGPNGQVGWLTTAFKSLSINNVILPGPKTKPTLIPAVTMKELTLDFTKNSWAPPSSSSNVEAQLKNPFGFPLGVSQLNMKVAATYQGGTVANLDIPDEKATTSSTGVVQTQFSNVPFKVASKELFTGFVTLLTSKSSASFGLKGTTNAVTSTNIGALQLNGIQFDVETSLAGFNNFGGKLNIDSLIVSDATSAYLVIDLVVSFVNPSNITIIIGDANFDIIVNQYNGFIGKTYMKDVTIPPGNKSYPCQLHMGEGSVDAKSISQALGDYMTGANVPLTVAGTTESTKITPLQNGLSTVKLDTTMYGIQANLIQQVAVTGSLIGMIFQNKANAAIKLQNPLGASFKITKVNAAVTFTPSTGGAAFKVGTIDYDVSNPTTIPGHGSATTDAWPVTLDTGSNPISHLMQMLGMLLDPNKYFYVEQNVTVSLGDGYTADMYYYQDKVPFSISIDGLPPIGITASDLNKISLPANLSSITDHTQLMGILSKILSGKSLDASSSIESASVTSSAPSSASVSPTPTTSDETTTSVDVTITSTDKITTSSDTSTTTTTTTTTTTNGRSTVQTSTTTSKDVAQTTSKETYTTKTTETPTTTQDPKETPKATETTTTKHSFWPFF